MGNFFSSAAKEAKGVAADLTNAANATILSRQQGQQPQEQGQQPQEQGQGQGQGQQPDETSLENENKLQGGRTRRRRKKKTIKNKTRGNIHFDKIKWGSFTKIYNNYIKNHPEKKNELPDLKHFATYVNKHPDQFNKKTHKKALFYTNILTH